MSRRVGEATVFAGVYGVAHFGKSLLWNASELLFAFFLTEACGLRGAQMGQILGLSLAVNAVADLCIGQFLRERVRSTLTAARFQLAGAIISGAAFVAFACTGSAPSEIRFGYALCAILVFRLAYALFDNPQNTILALATATDAERARLSSVRFVFGGLAKIGLASVFAPLLQGQHAAVQASRFAGLAVVLVVVAVAASALLHRQAARTSGLAAPRQSAGQAGEGGVSGWGSARFFLLVFATAIGFSIFAKLEPYFATYVLQSRLHGGTMMLCVAAGWVLGQPLWVAIARRAGLVGTLQLAAVTLIAGLAGFVLLARGEVFVTGLVSFVYGLGTGGVGMAQWAILAAISSGLKGRFGGTAAFGLFTCCSKLGLATAVFGLGALLEVTDYRAAGDAFAPVFLVMTGAPLVGALLVLLLSAGAAPGRPRENSPA